jgi:hypothetical protein
MRLVLLGVHVWWCMLLVVGWWRLILLLMVARLLLQKKSTEVVIVMNVTRKLNFINSPKAVSCLQRLSSERGRQTKAYIVLRWYSRCDSLSRRQRCYSQKYANNKKLLHFQQNHFHFCFDLGSLIAFGGFLNWKFNSTFLTLLIPHK